MKIKKIFFLLFFYVASNAYSLNCDETRKLISFILKMHMLFKNFDDELSQRTLDSFVKGWDPGKVYFLEQDVEGFKNKYATKLDDMIMAKDCSAIEDVTATYAKRFKEMQQYAFKMINVNHDFTKDEYMMIDRKKMQYAKTTEELFERWRQRVKFQLLQMKMTVQDLKKTQEKIKKRYELADKRHSEMNSNDVYSMFINAFATGLDPHSQYLSPEVLEDFRINTSLSLEGIGAVLKSEDGITSIQSMVPGGAAAKTGKLKVDDKIIAVAQEGGEPIDVIDMDLREVVQKIRGPGGTKVYLTILRDNADKKEQFVIGMAREKIQLTDRTAKGKTFKIQVVDEKTKEKTEQVVGVVSLPSFYMDFEGRQAGKSDFRSSSKDLEAEIAKLKTKGIQSLIVDLRGNGGGSLDESISVSGLFFDKGPVVQIKGGEKQVDVKSDDDGKTLYDGPLLVLIDRQSASASEIFAGAIKDYKRGLIVGNSHTFGKGSVQTMTDIDPKLGAVKVTISKFYRPLGASTQLKGVDSDVVLPDILDEYEIGEKYYDYAMPFSEIKSVKLDSKDSVSSFTEALKKNSSERIKSDAKYKELYADIEKYRKNENERSRVSLKEETKKDDKDKKKDKDKKANEEEGELLSDEIPLDKDLHLQEAIRIAGDYFQLLNKKSLGKITILDLGSPELAKESNSAKKEPAKKK